MATFFVFAIDFGLAVFDGRALVAVFAVFRLAVLRALALFAFGLAADLALTARFAVFAEVFFAADRAVDRRKPFVRLLLMCGFSKGCSTFGNEQPQDARSLP